MIKNIEKVRGIANPVKLIFNLKDTNDKMHKYKAKNKIV